MKTVHASGLSRPAAATRRTFLSNSAVALAGMAWPAINFAATGDLAERKFAPLVGDWRTFEVTTRVDIAKPVGVTKVWLPIPSVNTDWQISSINGYSSNGQAKLAMEPHSGARMLYAEFADGTAQPFVELTSRIQTKNRAQDWSRKGGAVEDAESLKAWTQPTHLLPVDGIVLDTAKDATRGAKTDVEKAQRIFDWIVTNTYRNPLVRGCGEGDIKSMLETQNLGGKCADLNALFVGMCRSLGLPARDVYGIRVAPSAFGYKELGGNSASLKGAQHCRAEVYLKGYGWVGMDPADVAKVMRQETSEWIKDAANPVVAPVKKSLFGGWEGNWMAYNTAHDVNLPGAKGPQLGFLMYPVAENALGRIDSYAPDDFKYQITAKEIKA